MRSIALAAAIMMATPTDAAACHRFTVWKFPWPQRCASGRPSAARPVSLRLPPAKAGPEPSVGLGDPTLTDEEVRARLMLRAAMENAR